MHQAALVAEDITVTDGVAVTTVARTVLDLARTRSMPQAVATGDAALPCVGPMVVAGVTHGEGVPWETTFRR